MKFQLLFFFLLLTCMYLSLAQGSYGNCCLGVAAGMKKNVKRNVESYRMQETDGDCNRRAVVFLMKKRPEHPKQRTICADPYQPWVQALMRDVARRMAN
ncbi:C-C motif chemokine 25b [Centroberyx affinis]|uniref:C-C motif chemokine 25b n=1 Tax=Centroberyx affinis TaxID=166261 RepID=UPI003A5C12D6